LVQAKRVSYDLSSYGRISLNHISKKYKYPNIIWKVIYFLYSEKEVLEIVNNNGVLLYYRFHILIAIVEVLKPSTATPSSYTSQ